MIMTNEEKARELALNLFYDGIFYQDYESQKQEIQSAIMEMAKWKDDEYTKEIESLQRKLIVEKGYRRQIEQAVKSLPNSVKDLIKAFNMII